MFFSAVFVFSQFILKMFQSYRFDSSEMIKELQLKEKIDQFNFIFISL